MQCPKCALYHPARYDQCVSCGSALVADNEALPSPPSVATQMSRGIRQPARGAQPQQQAYSQAHDEETDEDEESQSMQKRPGGLPMFAGIAIAAFILCASAGVTVFFLTKPPENQRLLDEGQRQLKLGQYAFALKSLNEAHKMKPDDPKVLLALARAYVGVEQVDKAWDLIVQAQQLGLGVVAEPELASDLANYYRQHGQFQRAIELLRPLAASNVAGKRAELSDLDASWGDQALQDGDAKQALRCWEEVKEMHEGSRFNEADSRLATIYAKIGEEMMHKGDGDEALKYYAKLNAMAPSAASLQRTAELYEKQGKLELAIDQLRKAVKLTNDAEPINRRLATLMASRGKELMDGGDSDAGYGYMQQAQALDPKIRVPGATIRNVRLEVDPAGAHLTGEVWNPGADPINSLTVHTELVDTKGSRTLWSRDFRVVDEFVPPLGSKESRPLDVPAAANIADPASTELRVYLNGAMYRTYALAKGGKESTASGAISTVSDLNLRPALRPRIKTMDPAAVMPPTAPDKVIHSDVAPAAAPSIAPVPATSPTNTGAAPTPGASPEEKTLKDLE